jgi:hypothetical protein
MNGLAQFQDMRVVAEDGTRLGRVFDIRSPGRAETEPTYRERRVDCLVCGRRGILERLGWKQPSAHAVPWKAVLGISDGVLRVKGSAADYTAGTAA